MVVGLGRDLKFRCLRPRVPPMRDPHGMTKGGIAAAGASSEAKYQQLLRSWRRRNRKVFAIVAVICGSFLGDRSWQRNGGRPCPMAGGW